MPTSLNMRLASAASAEALAFFISD
jgi:hypothetical protein